MNIKKTLRNLVLIVILTLCLAPSVQAAYHTRARIWPYYPGEDIVLKVFIRGLSKKLVVYDLEIHYDYDGGWWAGGCGPATAKYGNQYWMECHWQTGCTEWWRGEILPKSKKEIINIPLTTNKNWQGFYSEAATIQGTVNGRSVKFSVPIRTRKK